VVGSDLLKNIQGAGAGFIFRDTRVAGLHPFTGGRLVLNFALFKNVTKDWLTDSFEFIEKVSGVFNENISALLKNIAKTSGIVLDGIDKLVDGKHIEPVFAIHQELDADVAALKPGFYVMIGRSDKTWDESAFFVDETNALRYGNDLSSAKPFRDEDYILFSINRADERSDYDQLPFYKSYDNVLAFAAQFPDISAEQKAKVKSMLYTLNFEMLRSPDLTQAQAGKLLKQFVATVTANIEPKFNFGAAGKGPKPGLTPADKKLEELEEEIDLKIAAL
jgi:hypothetical protein